MNNNDVPFPGAAAVLSEPKMAAKIKEKSALGHFNNFLKSFWTQNQRQFPPDHTTTRHELIQYEELTPDLFGKFAHYLVNAKHRNEPRKNAPHASAGHQLLSIGSACGYLSAIKIYFIRTRFPNMSTPVAFERKQWLSLNAKLHGLITERCKGIEQPLLNPNRSATLDDWKDLACLCAWNGGSRLAEFWFTCVAMVHMAAKVNETAYLKHHHGKTVAHTSAGQMSNRVAQFSVNNHKQAWLQDMYIIPHNSLWQMDFFFAAAVHYALSPKNSEYLCPSFANEVSSNKNSSGILQQWTRRLGECRSFFESIKKFMTESCNMSRQGLSSDICTHSGRKDLHDMKAAKICAGWTTRWYDEIWGGFNNTTDDLSVEREKFDSFCRNLFPNQCQQMDLELMYLHGLSVLRFFDDFKGCVASKPSPPNSTTPDNLFLAKVSAALATSKISQATFSQWQQDVARTFKERNFYGLSIEASSENMRVDTRPLLQQVQQLREVVKVKSEQIAGLDRKIVGLDRKIDSKFEQVNRNIDAKFEQVNRNIDSKFEQVNSNIALLLRLAQQGQPVPSDISTTNPNHDTMSLENVDLPVPAVDAAESVTAVASQPTYDTLTLGRYPNGSIPMAFIFKSWFNEDLPQAYKHFKRKMNRQPMATNDISKLEKKRYLAKLRTHFSMTKKAMHCMIKNLEDYPKEGDDYEMLAKRAFQSMKSKYPGRFHKNIGEISRNTVNTLFREENYETKPWPIGTPESIIAFFDDKGANKTGYYGSRPPPKSYYA